MRIEIINVQVADGVEIALANALSHYAHGILPRLTAEVLEVEPGVVPLKVYGYRDSDFQRLRARIREIAVEAGLKRYVA